jgi:hypothetical protein
MQEGAAGRAPAGSGRQRSEKGKTPMAPAEAAQTPPVTESPAEGPGEKSGEQPGAHPVTELYRTNLAAFKRWAPQLYSRLAALEAPVSELVVDPEGRVDMRLRGQGFYRGDAEGYTSQQLAKFFARPVRQPISEPDAKKLKGFCGIYCQAVTERLAAAGIAYDPQHCPPESHSLIAFGLGLGLHVETLIARSDARLVILIEPNLEFLHHSLYVTEWHALFEEAEERGRKIKFVVDLSSSTIAAQVKHILRGNSPTMLDGIYLYTHYPSVILEQAKERIRQDLFLILSGLGYFEDEVVMVRNTVANLSGQATAILARPHPSRPEPLFIVGSGPSADRDLDFIADHAGRAAVMSIGTSLRVLLSHGIQPDFHIDLENTPGNLEIITPTAEQFDLSGITLVGASSVQPGLARFFENRVFFLRERVSSSTIFRGPFDVLQPSGPTVANAGLVAAIRMGFREIYLFGVDMGSKIEGQFHAKHTVYGEGLRAEVAVAHQRFPGNFGGEASGETFFNWARRVLEAVIAVFASVKVYNCSDGVRIAGAVPKVARAIELPEAPVDRSALRQSLAESFQRYDPERLAQAWQSEDRRAEMAEVLDRIEAVLERAGAAPEPAMDWLHQVFELVHPDDKSREVVASFLSGTLLLCMGSANWYDRRVAEPAQRPACRRILIEEFGAVIAEIRRQFDALIEEVDVLVQGAQAQVVQTQGTKVQGAEAREAETRGDQAPGA